jgi:Rieske Fe-S protein
MNMNRREFMILSAAFCAGCAANQPIHLQTTSIDAGPVSKYRNDGVYAEFEDKGFFVVRRGKQLVALSSVCTHRGCQVTAEADRSYKCHCHGSEFNAEGRVTHGPAIHDLPELPSSVDGEGHLIIHATAVG